MSFQNPQLLLLLLICGLLYWKFFKKRGGESSFRYSSVAVPAGVAGRSGEYKYRIISGLFILSWVLAVFSLAGPRESRQLETRLSDGVDIVIVFDVSGSMAAVDDDEALQIARRRGSYHDQQGILTNRMEHAKELTRKFIQGRTEDRIGLVVFAGYSVIQCPPTFDHDLLLALLEDVGFDTVTISSTAIGDAIASGVNRLKHSEAKSRVLLLMTDGENNDGSIDPITAAGIAKTMGVRIHSIGIGSQTPLIPARGYDNHYVAIRDRGAIDSESLTQIAEMTGGQFFHARRGDMLREIFQEIDTLETSLVEKKIFTEYRSKYQVFLIAALAALLAALVLRYTVFRMYM